MSTVNGFARRDWCFVTRLRFLLFADETPFSKTSSSLDTSSGEDSSMADVTLDESAEPEGDVGPPFDSLSSTKDTKPCCVGDRAKGLDEYREVLDERARLNESVEDNEDVLQKLERGGRTAIVLGFLARRGSSRSSKSSAASQRMDNKSVMVDLCLGGSTWDMCQFVDWNPNYTGGDVAVTSGHEVHQEAR